MKKKTQIALISFLIFFGCIFNGYANGQKDSASVEGVKELEKITVAYHPHIVGAGAMLNAIEKGYFKEAGLEVDLVEFTSGAVELQAMASGDIDIGYLGVGAHVFAPKGQAIIIALDSTDVSGEIMVRKDSGIRNMTDLKGKQVAISAGTTSEMILALALGKYGMNPDDIEAVNMDTTAKVTAMMTGRIDAISIEAPHTDRIREKLGPENVITVSGSADFLPESVFTNSWVVTPKYMESNRDTVVKFMKAWVQGTQYRNDNMDESCQRVADFLHVDVANIKLTADKTNFMSTQEMKELYENGTINEYYNTLINTFVGVGKLDMKYKVDSTEFVDFGPFLEAMNAVYN